MSPDTSLGPPSPSGVSKWHSRANGRLAVGALILLGEYLALTVRFDAGDVLTRGGAWIALARAGNLASWAIAGATAFLLVAQFHNVRSGSVPQAGSVSGWLLLLHAALAVALASVTQLTFSSKQPPVGPAVLWLLVWSLLVGGTALSLLIAVVGNWGWLLRTLGRVVVVGGALGLLASLAGVLSNFLWEPLSRATLFLVVGTLKFIGLEVFVEPSARLIDLEGFAVEIAPACSGFEGIGMYVVLMGAFLYQVRETLRFPRAFLLLPVGMVLIWLGNALRIASLMLVGARVDPDIALGSFHSKAGWVFFAAITLAIAAMARKSTFFTLPDNREPAEHSENQAAPLIVPLLAWTAVGLLTSMWSGRHDLLYGVRVIVAAAALWKYRGRIRQWFQRPTVLAFTAGLLVGLIWLAVPSAAPRENSKPVLAASLGQLGFIGWVIVRCIGAVVVIPICEELAFRGYLARRLTRREFWKVPLSDVSWIAVAGSAIAFAAVHERVILGALAGFVYVWLVRRSGRLTDGIVAHALSNAVIAAWVLITGDWRHW